MKKIRDFIMEKIWLESQMNVGQLFYVTIKERNNGTASLRLYK
jgi:hypothetical protein